MKDTAYRSQSFVGNHIHARFMCDFNNSMSMSIYELSICAQKSIILNEIERPKNAATIAMFVLSKCQCGHCANLANYNVGDIVLI